jgi:MSHA biogenesis protein MshQ
MVKQFVSANPLITECNLRQAAATIYAALQAKACVLVGIVGLLLSVWVAPASAVTYAYRNDVFAYDTPSAAATAVTWHTTSPAPACTQYPNGDDDWADITFPGGMIFTFGGVGYSTVRIYSNGVLAFGTDVSGFHRDFGPQALPAPAGATYTGCPTAAPVNIMLPYWIDIVAGTASGTTGASVKYELVGTAPNRRLVVSWVNVKLYTNTNRFNFQVALYESTLGSNGNFRYQYSTGSSDGVGAAVGVQLSQTDFTQYSFNQNFIDTTNGTAILWFPANQLATKAAEYRFDESFWTGVAGEIKDTSGSNQNASISGAVTNIAGGKLCRGGSFSANTLNTTIDAVITPVVPGNTGSVDFWFNSNVRWNTAAAMLFDASKVATQPFYLLKSATGALTFVVSDNAGTRVTATAPAATYALNTWHHIAVTWSLRAGTNQTALQIFIDGVLQTGATRGTTNGAMPALNGLAIGDNRTSGVTPTGGTPNGANGVIDEVYVYPIQISAPQVVADFGLTRATCTALDHFHIIHDGAVSGCTSAASITIEAHDATHNLFPLAGTSMALSTTPAHGTWSNLVGGAVNPLTAIGAGTGTANYTFANESRVTLGLTNIFSEALNINVTSGAITEGTGAAATCVAADYTTGTVCDASRVFVCSKAMGFNCIEPAADPLTGHLFTKLAGTPFAFDVVALKDGNSDGIADAVETAYASDTNKSVTVELVDGSGVTACIARTAVSPAVSQTLVFNKANQPTELGRKSAASMTVSNAYSDLRCRVTDTSASPTIVACSTDNFSARPAAFAVSSSATADSTGASAVATPIVTAGGSFTLTAAAGVAGYNQTPKLDANKVLAHAGALQAGVVTGSFGAANVLTGSATGAAFAYSEVGYFSLAARGIYDDTFTAVDAGVGDCVTGFVDAGGKFACSFGSTAATAYFGRFVPDHFEVVGASMLPGCLSGGLTYMGQPMSFGTSIEARNLASGKTSNYRGSFAKGAVSMQAENANDGIALGSRLTFTAPWSDGAASVLASQFSRPTGVTADSTWGPYDQLSLGVSVSDADGVLLINRNMDQGSTTCTADAAGASNGNCPAVAFGSAQKMRYGRLRLQNAYGSELLPLPMSLTAQYWTGSGFALNTADSCTSLQVPTSSSGMVFGAGNLAAGETTASIQGLSAGSGVLLAGDAAFRLTAPGSGNNGYVTITVATPSWLKYPWISSTATDASARATFGIYKSPLIYRRENY